MAMHPKLMISNGGRAWELGVHSIRGGRRKAVFSFCNGRRCIGSAWWGFCALRPDAIGYTFQLSTRHCGAGTVCN